MFQSVPLFGYVCVLVGVGCGNDVDGVGRGSLGDDSSGSIADIVLVVVVEVVVIVYRC